MADKVRIIEVRDVWYNFERIHKPLPCTPAMEAGISDHVWAVRELLEAA